MCLPLPTPVGPCEPPRSSPPLGRRAARKENVAVYVINMEAFPSRWKAMEKRLATAGIAATRVEGVDLRPPGALEAAAKRLHRAVLFDFVGFP